MFFIGESNNIDVIRIEIIIPENNIRIISEALKKIGVGGITVLKVKGRGKTQGPQIHASKGTELFTPEFSDKYVIHVIVSQEKETDVIEIVRSNSHSGKIFVSPVNHAVDIGSGLENEQAI